MQAHPHSPVDYRIGRQAVLSTEPQMSQQLRAQVAETAAGAESAVAAGTPDIAQVAEVVGTLGTAGPAGPARSAGDLEDSYLRAAVG